MALHSDCFTHRASHVRIIVHAIIIGMLGLLLLTEVFEWIYMVDHHDMVKLVYQDTWFYVGVLCVVVSAWLLAFYVSKKQGEQGYLSMLANAVEYSGEAISITNVQGKIQYVNPAFTKLTGYQPQETIGQSALDLLNNHAQSKENIHKMLATLKQGKSWQGSLVNKKKDGSFFPAIASISPVINKKGLVTHYITIQNDDSLTQQLHEKEIREAKMKSLATAVGGIAHEFNNILTGIMGNAFLVKLKEEDDALKEKLETIESLGDKAAGMVQQMLVYVGHELQAHTHVYININQLVQACVAVFNQEHRMHCKFQAWEDDVVIKGNVSALTDALMQLLINAKDAVDAVDVPEIIVKIEVPDSAVDSKNKPNHTVTYVCIRIIDNGPEIPHEIRDDIFEPFFTTKDIGKGTGLGLSAVYGIAKEHHGYVTLDETCMLGCTFLLCLPIVQEGDDTSFLGDAI